MRAIRKLWFRIRMALGRAAPLTIPGRRPAVMTEDDLDACLARRRQLRDRRSSAARKGHMTRRAGDGRSIPRKQWRIEKMRGGR